MNAEERIEAASKFLLQSPPGEINDVLNGELRSDHASTSFADCAPYQTCGTSSLMTTACKPVSYPHCEGTISHNSSPQAFRGTSTV